MAKGGGRLSMNKTRWMSCLALMAIVLFCLGADRPHSLRLHVRASPNAAYESSLELRDGRLARSLNAAATAKPRSAPQLSDVYVTVSEDGRERLYRMDSSGALWDEAARRTVVLPRSAAKKLAKKAALLRQRHYGRLTDWEEAKRALPRKSVFSITDVESGLTFRVQRRAGSDHADVQPLTKEDTRIMAQIYDRGWSWRRKAIIVETNGRRMAASMNGMPHGGDGIPDNGFSGHFCVHFLNSSTHKSDRPDPLHQLMVHKAAGTLRTYLAASSPLQLAQNAIAAIDHGDAEMIRLMTEGMDKSQSDALVELAGSLSSIRATALREPMPETDGALNAVVETDVAMQLSTGGIRRETMRFWFVRPAIQAPWRLQDAQGSPEKRSSRKSTS
jgi:hypothetical protein